MSLKEVLGKALTDEVFRSKLVNDPEKVLRNNDVNYDTDILNKIKKLTNDAFSSLSKNAGPDLSTLVLLGRR